MEFEVITDTFDVEVVSEMAIGEGTLVPLPKDIIDEISTMDNDPKFATFMIESGFSKSKRNWRPEILEKVSEQINTSGEPVVGYLGHISPEQDAFAFPEIQLHWLRSRCQRVGDKVRMYAKAYVLPEGKGRTYISRKLVRTVSMSGKAALKPMKDGVDVIDFDLESIDLARPRRAGMHTALVGGLTSEMETEGGRVVDAKEIAALTANDLRTHNPSLVTAIEDEARKPVETKVEEMETENSELKSDVDTLAKVREVLEIDEKADVLQAVGDILVKVKAIAKDAKEKVFDAVLSERFKDEQTRGLVKLALASEMDSVEIEDDSDESKKKVNEMIDKSVEGNEILRAVVSEQTGGGSSFRPPPVSRGTREIKPGYENDNIQVRKARR